MAMIQCAISLRHKDIVGFAFVDDTDLCVLVPEDSHVDAGWKMQQPATNWEGLIWVMGALVPDKCFWYHIDQEWQNDKWSYKLAFQALVN